MKFILMSKDVDGNVTKKTFEEESLSQILPLISDFLKGSGFSIDGTLDIVDEE